MIESILITNLNGGIIYSKYFKGTTAEIEEWERTLYKLTNESWNSAKNQKIELAVYGDKYIVYTSVDELLIFLTGTDEDDELALANQLTKIVEQFRSIVGKKGLTESALTEEMPTVTLALSEMFQFGHFDQYDPLIIEGLVNNNFSAKKKDIK